MSKRENQSGNQNENRSQERERHLVVNEGTGPGKPKEE